MSNQVKSLLFIFVLLEELFVARFAVEMFLREFSAGPQRVEIILAFLTSHLLFVILTCGLDITFALRAESSVASNPFRKLFDLLSLLLFHDFNTKIRSNFDPDVLILRDSSILLQNLSVGRDGEELDAIEVHILEADFGESGRLKSVETVNFLGHRLGLVRIFSIDS